MADRPARSRRTSARAGVRAAAVALLAVTVAGCGGAGDAGTGPGGVVAGAQPQDGDGMHGAVLDAPYTVGDATLVDTAGEEGRLRERLAAGQQLTLVFFGYTNCPDICQAVMADLASMRARLAEADAERVRVWFVTTDPARDDPATLRDYLDRFDPSFEGWTGPLDTVVEVATSVHVPIEKGPRLPTGGYDVTHGTPVLAVTPDGEVPVLWTEGTSAARLAEDVARLLGES